MDLTVAVPSFQKQSVSEMRSYVCWWEAMVYPLFVN
jgi:hypothetical protein